MRPEIAKLTSLAVYLQDRRIGIINRLAGDRHLFAFEEEYIDDPNRPTLSLSYKGRTGGLVTRVSVVNRRLPPFFSNLLPEGHLRAYLAQGAGVKPTREFFLMALLGGDVSGAVKIKPLEDERHDDGDDKRHHDKGDHDHQHEKDDDEHPDVLRFSLAGVQLKFSAVMESSGGLTIPASGVGGLWIVKLPSAHFDAVPENELTMLELARAVGIDVPACRLVPVADIQGLPEEAARLPGKALAVERFDRGSGDERIHMEDFAQVFGVFPESKYKGYSYANIASVLWAEAGPESTYEFVRRLTFSVVIGNGDMHLKNWSLLYPDGRTPVLSPAYDFVSTLPYIAGDPLALSFGGIRSLEGITIDQVRRFTDTARLPVKPVWETVQETIERTAMAWKTLPQKDLISANTFMLIDRQIMKVTG